MSEPNAGKKCSCQLCVPDWLLAGGDESDRYSDDSGYDRYSDDSGCDDQPVTLRADFSDRQPKVLSANPAADILNLAA